MLEWRGHRQTLDPAFAALIHETLAPLPYFYVVTSGLRSSDEQDALYAQGRTRPGPIVTNAEAGDSPHNFGMAGDIYPLVAGVLDLQGPTASTLPAWQAMWDAVAREPRLKSGRLFNIDGHGDAGHVELREWKRWRDAAATVPLYIPWSSGSPGSPVEGGQAPTWEWPVWPSDAPLGAAPESVPTEEWFELSPAAAVAGVMVLGIVVYAWTRRGSKSRARRRAYLSA